MEKIQEYYKLKLQRKMIDERLEKLNKEIKQEMMEKEAFQIQTEGLVANLQVKRSKPEVDVPAAEHLLEHKMLLDDDCYIQVFNPDVIESFYLQGLLSDDDVRSIGAVPKVTTALIVEEHVSDV